MLVVNDKRLLGDGRVSAKEALDRYAYDTDQQLNEHRLTDRKELINAERRQGQMMHHSDLILKIKRLNPNVIVEQQINFPDELGFYFHSHITGEYIYLSSFKKGWMPEFSLLVEDMQRLPVGQVRGWRTVLVRLLELKALTWADVKETFGDALNLNSSRWERETQRFRN